MMILIIAITKLLTMLDLCLGIRDKSNIVHVKK